MFNYFILFYIAIIVKMEKYFYYYIQIYENIKNLIKILHILYLYKICILNIYQITNTKSYTQKTITNKTYITHF